MLILTEFTDSVFFGEKENHQFHLTPSTSGYDFPSCISHDVRYYTELKAENEEVQHE